MNVLLFIFINDRLLSILCINIELKKLHIKKIYVVQYSKTLQFIPLEALLSQFVSQECARVKIGLGEMIGD